MQNVGTPNSYARVEPDINKPVALGAITPAQLNTELEKGYADIAAGRVRDLDDVVAEMERDYGT